LIWVICRSRVIAYLCKRFERTAVIRRCDKREMGVNLPSVTVKKDDTLGRAASSSGI